MLLGALLLLSTLSFGQETEFKLSPNGFTDFIVTDCDGKTAVEMYLKTLDWISKTYDLPKEVIKSTVENEYIRIEGSSKILISINAGLLGKGHHSGRYQIEISFKDDKYKFDLIKLERYQAATQYARAGWYDVPLETNIYFNKKGKLRSKYKYYPEIAIYFNELNKSLQSYILDDYQASNDNSDW